MELINHNDKLYIPVRSIRKESFAQDEKLNLKNAEIYRNMIGCDHVLQNESHFIFCRTVLEAEIENE
jgi:hypothetical protein